MAARRQPKRLNIRAIVSDDVLPIENVRTAEQLVARMIVRAFIAEYSECLPTDTDAVSGSAPTARADAVAPAAEGADPE